MVGLRPFASEHELSSIAFKCHTALWERHGLDPIQAFDEFSKLLFARFYDEKVNFPNLKSLIQFNETPLGFSSRVLQLFENARKAYPGIFDREAAEIKVDPHSIFNVFELLGTFSIWRTTQSGKVDLKGTIYEKIINNTFRGKLGQFFTHRKITEFMVRLLSAGPSETIYDPSCGTGGFLIAQAGLTREGLSGEDSATDQFLREYSQSRLLGTEINERTARIAKLNFLMHGLDYSGIHCLNALTLLDGAQQSKPVREESVDVIFANPPFAGFEKNVDVLARFGLAKGHSGEPVAVTREVLFIELILRFLKDGGRAGIVIPQGVFSNRNLAYVRDFIRAHAEILAVIELPDWAFIPSGTNVRGSLLFIRKAEKPTQSYDVFISKADHLGFKSTGRPDSLSDFPRIISAYRDQLSDNMVSIAQLQSRLDAKFHLRSNRQLLEVFRSNPRHKMMPLYSLGSFNPERFSTNSDPDRDIQLVEVGDVDTNNYEITPKLMRAKEAGYSSLRIARPGDILISRRRTYRGAIVQVPQDVGVLYAIPEFSVLRLQGFANTDYVLAVLRSPKFVQLMTLYSTGEMSGRISEDDLKSLLIPLPANQNAIGKQVREMQLQMSQHVMKAQHLRRSVEALIDLVVQPSRQGDPVKAKIKEAQEVLS